MASLKDLRNRIASVKATRKITKAMQMVAAAKLRRAQEAAQAARPYATRMDAVLANLNEGGANKADAAKLLTGTGRDDVHLLLVMTAERGLCGGFNSNIARKARADIQRLTGKGKTVKILCVGKKGFEALRRDYGDVIVDTIDFRAVKSLGYANAEEVAARVFEMFDKGEFDVCTMYFSEFKTVMTQVPTGLQLVPARLPDASRDDGKNNAGARAGNRDKASAATGGGGVYNYEPGSEEILGYLLKRNVRTQIFRGLLENSASEQGSRMTAMDSATRNAGDMIDKLTMTYNRQRQAQITKELIEIISGAEAV